MSSQFDEVRDEMRGVREEVTRMRMIDHALQAERDEHAWLNWPRGLASAVIF